MIVLHLLAVFLVPAALVLVGGLAFVVLGFLGMLLLLGILGFFFF